MALVLGLVSIKEKSQAKTDDWLRNQAQKPQQIQEKLSPKDSLLQPLKKWKAMKGYDFTPGDTIIYATDFDHEVLSEIPAGWNSNGPSVLVAFDQHPGKWLQLAQKSTVLTSNEQFFGTHFTIAFDLLMDLQFGGPSAPSLTFGLLATGQESPQANKWLSYTRGEQTQFIEIIPFKEGGNIRFESYHQHQRYFHQTPQAHPSITQWFSEVVPVAIQVQGERIRIWVKGEKLYDVPKALVKGARWNQLFFTVSSSSYRDEQMGFYINNLKIAKGIPDLRQMLVQKGQFSTTGIQFDSNSAMIKASSAAVLQQIAQLLHQDPQLQLEIVGHTDADGDDGHNQLLSEKRAESVKRALVEVYEISADRLSTSGKGEQELLDKGTSPEAKAKNRRVVFIKK